MAPQSKGRGKHPADEDLFAADKIPALLEAARDLAWLKTRGYADASSIKIVGDRYSLTARQRTAVIRSSCSDQALKLRQQSQVKSVAGQTVYIDGFNLLTTIEAVLSVGVLLIGRDQCLRDMSSMHGNYRVLAHTEQAIEKIHHHLLVEAQAKSIVWYLDKPVSNSGRLKGHILANLPDQWLNKVSVELLPDPDPVLKQIGQNGTIITADSGILCEAGPWYNCARDLVGQLDTSNSIVVDFSVLTILQTYKCR